MDHLYTPCDEYLLEGFKGRDLHSDRAPVYGQVVVAVCCPDNTVVGKKLLNNLEQGVSEFHWWACPCIQGEGGAIPKVVRYQSQLCLCLGKIQQLESLKCASKTLKNDLRDEKYSRLEIFVLGNFHMIKFVLKIFVGITLYHVNVNSVHAFS